MLRYLFLVGFLTIATLSIGVSSGNIIIASFNIQSLGPTKMGRPEFVKTAIRIIANYDIILIQEIKDSTILNVITQLVNELNSFVKYVKIYSKL